MPKPGNYTRDYQCLGFPRFRRAGMLVVLADLGQRVRVVEVVATSVDVGDLVAKMGKVGTLT